MTKCTRCSNPSRPEFKTCEACAEKNKARNAQKRAWDRKNYEGDRRRKQQYEWRKKKRGGKPTHHEVARDRERTLVLWAIRHSRLPTSREASKILRMSTVYGGALVRKRAFGLRNLSDLRGGGHARIPYPVPSEYLEKS